MFRRKSTNKNKLRDSLVAQWLGGNSSSAEGLASVPGGGNAVLTSHTAKRKKKMCLCVRTNVCPYSPVCSTRVN